ncbi:glycosyltransferase [Jiangella alba]|uniref:Sterol 3beta-glucosyltransferase n=1 Tax=Jiangella alba TaxID=561176 RepID=A0A1H5JVC6_9ACTN|nr:glycosyltransferase [Jiangella alba]SEE56529.1 sterol 3beta-glucosyltransferase [Jiangella alba]
MDTLVLTDGTRGDVQPFVALASALRTAGHRVTLVGPESSMSLATEHDVPFVPLTDSARTEIVERRAPNTVGRNGLMRMHLALRIIRENRMKPSGKLRELADASARGADVLVHHTNVPGHHLAEWLGIPAVPVCPFPYWVPTSSFPDPTLPFALPPSLNRASYGLNKALPTNLLLRLYSKKHLSRWRRDALRLPARRGQHDLFRRPDGERVTFLQAFSRHMLPAPVTYPDWVETTGFWYLPASPGWSPPAGLAEFVNDGEPPIFVGFGSMVGADPRRTTRVVADALRNTKSRAVVATAWGGLDPDGFGEDVFCLEQVPFDWLFPRVSVVVHHGGGTIGAALSAGRPQVLCPFMFDQPFNAQCMHDIGVAPPPQPERDLTADGLAKAINVALTDDGMAQRAAEVGRRIRDEDGLGAAVRTIESAVA